jgi:hypothetical protein
VTPTQIAVARDFRLSRREGRVLESAISPINGECSAENAAADDRGSHIAFREGVNESRVIAWRPKPAVPPPVVRQSEYLWTMVKQRWQIDCVIEEGGRLGWTVRVLINRRLFFRCLFPTWPAAIDAAEIKYAELFSAGWAPGPISASDDPATFDS